MQGAQAEEIDFIGQVSGHGCQGIPLLTISLM